MPLRSGKFTDEDAVREKFLRTPALWNQWISAAKNYAVSDEVRDGFVLTPMKFISGRWRDWEQAEEPQGAPFVPDLSWQKTMEEEEKLAREQIAARGGKRPLIRSLHAV